LPNKLQELLQSIMGEIKQIAVTEAIIGEPVTLGDKMVVPVSRIMVGFGVGGGEGSSDKQGEGFGGGGGGGVRIDPVGFIVIDGDKVQFLATRPGKFEGLIEAIPDLFNKLKGLKKGRKGGKGKDKDAEENEDKKEDEDL
jgi:uncharacterized spore protein YtfJ